VRVRGSGERRGGSGAHRRAVVGMGAREGTPAHGDRGGKCGDRGRDGEGRTPHLCRGHRECVNRAMGPGHGDHEVSRIGTAVRVGTRRAITSICP